MAPITISTAPSSLINGKRRLAANAKFLPDFTADICDMGECIDAHIGDELAHRREVVTTGDADHVYFTGKLFLHQCDRTGFSDTTWSPGRPKPQDKILPGVVARVEL